MTRTLFIDATMSGAALALIDVVSGGSPQYIATALHCDNARSTAALADLTAALLKSAALTLGSIEQVVVAAGPGSFTGIKVGMAFAEALVLGSSDRLRIVGVSGLEALARGGEAEILWLVPSTRTEGYGAFRTTGGRAVTAVALCESGSLVLRDGMTRAELPLPSSIREWRLLQPWASATAAAATYGRALAAPVMPRVSHDVLISVAEALCDPVRQDLFLFGRVEPRYIRMSAPEERRGVRETIHGT